MKLIVLPHHWVILSDVLPGVLRQDFNEGRRRTSRMPYLLRGSEPYNLEQGLSWGVVCHSDAIEVQVVDPDQNLSYTQVREFEDRFALREHPEILFSPITQGNDETYATIVRNLMYKRPWDTGLLDS